MRRYIIVSFVMCVAWIDVHSQSTGSTSNLTKKNIESVARITASHINSKKTANSKDIITTFFRASIDNLLGEDRTYVLNSSFYGINRLFSRNVAIDYERERVLRHNTFNLGFTGDESSKITNIAGGLTITILDKRDIKSERYHNGEFNSLVNTEQIISGIRRGLCDYFAKFNPEYYNTKEGLKIRQAIDESWNRAFETSNFSGIDTNITNALKDYNFDSLVLTSNKTNFSSYDFQGIKENILNGGNPLTLEYEKVAMAYAQKPFWSISPKISYDRIHKQGEYSLASTFTFGLGKSHQKPWEFEAKSQFKIANDSSVISSNYNDKPLSLSIGLNKVLLENKAQESAMEFKFFTQYNYQFGNTSPGLSSNVFTLNTTLRVNLYKSLWLPITIKYDPDKGSVFGLFTLTANIDN
ncbi:MAG: hypothetical protein ACQUHE_09050 [Bacteroidia bacterium]